MATLGKDRSILPLGKVDLSKWIHNGRSIQFTAVRSAPDRSDDRFYFPAPTASPAAPVTLRSRRPVARVTCGTDESLVVSVTYLRRDYGSL
jgi:hypothetical protein